MNEKQKIIKWTDLPTIPIFKDYSGIKAGQTVAITREDILAMRVIGLSSFTLTAMVNENLGKSAEKNNLNVFFHNQPDSSCLITFTEKVPE